MQTKVVSAISSAKITITNGRLTIHDPERDVDTSSFFCEATNEFGTIRSSKANVKYIGT